MKQIPPKFLDQRERERKKKKEKEN